MDILIPMAATTSRAKPARPGLLPAREDRADRLADLFHALSDPTRLRILSALRNGEQCVCNLTGLLVAQQSRLSFHMKTLKDAGIVKDRREGRWIHYSLVPEAVEEIRLALEDLAEAAKASAATCCRR
jgi:ArsR family transcriptional regulator, arsenate/arsenite/antimonite-responsive transcriptional repressor